MFRNLWTVVLSWLTANNRALQRIERKIEIMAKEIQDFAAQQKERDDAIQAGLTSIADGVKALDAKIIELNNTPGPITPEDQALLDELAARSSALVAQVNAVAEDANNGQQPT